MGRRAGACDEAGLRRGDRHQAECAFLFLGVVQAQYGVEAVEKASKLDDVLGLDVVVVQAGEQRAETAHLVFDFGVRTAQAAGRRC